MHTLGVTFYVNIHNCPRHDTISKISSSIRNYFSPYQGTLVPELCVGRYEHDQKREEIHRLSEVFGEHESTEGWVVQVPFVQERIHSRGVHRECHGDVDVRYQAVERFRKENG